MASVKLTASLVRVAYFSVTKKLLYGLPICFPRFIESNLRNSICTDECAGTGVLDFRGGMPKDIGTNSCYSQGRYAKICDALFVFFSHSTYVLKD